MCEGDACRIQIIVIDVHGQRHTLRALTGHTLIDVMQEHEELLGDEGKAICRCF